VVAHQPLTRAFIEFIHDVLVGLWMPFDEHVDSSDYKDINLIESAAGRPFQTFGGSDLYPSVSEKAAVLFHSLVCNHSFRNGNKRTAVIGVDMFLAVNGYALAMNNLEVYELATETAKSNAEGRKLDDVIARLIRVFSENAVDVSLLDASNEVAKQVGSDLVQRLVDRLAWYDKLIKDLPPQYRSKPKL